MLGVALAAILVQSALSTPSSSSPSPVVRKVTNRNGEEVICKEMRVTGSRLYANYCLTPMEWDHVHDMSIQALYPQSNRYGGQRGSPGGATSGGPGGL